MRAYRFFIWMISMALFALGLAVAASGCFLPQNMQTAPEPGADQEAQPAEASGEGGEAAAEAPAEEGGGGEATAEAPAEEAAPAGPDCAPTGTAGVQGSTDCCSRKTRWGANAEGWICCDGGDNCT